MVAECRSNSMGAVGTSSASDMFSSLLNDTEEHFRQHRNNLSVRVGENQSASVHVKPEVKINVTSSLSSQSSEEESNLDFTLQTQKDNANARVDNDNECAAISSDLNNSQLLTQQDQCCPGFTISKSSKMRHQGNSCIIV